MLPVLNSCRFLCAGSNHRMYDYDSVPPRGIDIDAMREAIALALTREQARTYVVLVRTSHSIYGNQYKKRKHGHQRHVQCGYRKIKNAQTQWLHALRRGDE
eukprot:1139306-Pelagomonas_calceolata.AAC.1